MKPWTTRQKLRWAACFGLCLACSPGADDTGEQAEEATYDGRPLNVETYSRAFEVDCLGMSVTTLDGTAYGTTRTPTYGDLTVDELALIEAYGQTHPVASVPRCGYWFEPTLEPGAVDLLTLDTFEFNTEGTGMLKIAYDGELWTPHLGDIVLDGEPGNDKADGTYDAIFTNGEEFARIQGRFGWCEPAVRDDCSYGVDGLLPYPFEVQMPGRVVTTDPTFGWGTASDCRVLIDPVTTGMQLDLQVAFWKDSPVTQLYTGACPNTPPDVMNHNHLMFRTGGVTGPGSYGPFAVHDYGDTTLPQLEFITPFSFLYAGQPIDPAGFCALAQGGFSQGLAQLTHSSECTLDVVDGVGGEPGEIRLTCSEVDHHFPGGEVNNDAVGDFDLWARCDVEYR